MSDAMDRALAMVRDGHLVIDAEGRIWRTAILNHGAWLPIKRRRAESAGGKGYLRVMLDVGEGRVRGASAHRLVWIVANGPIPDGLEINHKDLNKKNNALANLEVVTPSENVRHSYANGQPMPWSKATTWRGKVRLSEADIAEVRRLRSDGVKLRDIAEKFGRSVGYIGHLVTS